MVARAKLDAMIDEATVDAYNDHEQMTGLFTMLDEHLAVPFDTELLGIAVAVRTTVGMPVNVATVDGMNASSRSGRAGDQ